MGLVRLAFRRSFAMVDRYAEEWAASNARELLRDGPLWVVLGDSAAQGVGASSYDNGWVGLVRRRLGPPWRVVNLSRSGARTRDVLGDQWPQAEGLRADLLTAVVGGNDAVHTKETVWLADVDRLVGALPAGAVVSTTARGVFERKTARVNAHLRTTATAKGLRVADLWEHTGPPYRGLYFDGLHPNDNGYRQWADAVLAALPEELTSG